MKAIMKIVIGVFIIMNLQLIYLEAFPSTSLTIDEPTELNTGLYDVIWVFIQYCQVDRVRKRDRLTASFHS